MSRIDQILEEARVRVDYLFRTRFEGGDIVRVTFKEAGISELPEEQRAAVARELTNCLCYEGLSVTCNLQDGQFVFS